MAKENDTARKRPIQYYASTLFIVIFFVILEIAILAVHVLWISRAVAIASLLLRLLSLLVTLYIVNQDYSTAYKLAWCIPILLFPMVGGLAYTIAKSRRFHKRAKDHAVKVDRAVVAAMPKCEVTGDNESLYGKENIHHYLQNKGFVPSHGDKVTYYDMADKMLTDLLNDLESAEHFIFMEYFIIQEGVMWDSILEVLKRKAAKGVDVRILYDGMGSIRTLPASYPKQLADYGIKAKPFSPFVPVLSTLQNNRDHRKITVIDGKIAYTGGTNLADEYINEVQRYGVWKDAAIRMEGGSAQSFTRFFLSQWNLKDAVPDREFASFFGRNEAHGSDETIIPYTCSPLDDRSFAKEVYLQIIQGAKRYLYIMTPYFIPGEEILNALKIAAESGVDVRLCTPHISDNKPIHAVSRSKYDTLLASGVKIYEYTPGFIHSKNIVSDDAITTCGSVNMDYRSLYLHFECGSVVIGKQTASAVKEDFLKTQAICREITREDAQKRGFFTRIYLALIRTFEPLL